jgi:hypothetical protein
MPLSTKWGRTVHYATYLDDITPASAARCGRSSLSGT